MPLTLRHEPRISAATFRAVLAKGTDAGPSPLTSIAQECYDIIVAAGLDPAFLLAIFARESQYGVTGIAPRTKSWGNVRTAQVPARSPATIGGFAAYPSWRIGLIDLCDRLNDRYIAKGLTTPEAIFPVYAPASENDTAAYIAFINRHVAAWQAEEQGASMVGPTIGFADRTALLPVGDNRPGDKLTSSSSFTVHETANENAGATAEMHRRYWSPGGAGRTVSSAHVVADALESIQLIPTDEQAWHAGDVTGNTTSVGGEICVNDRASFPTACRRMARFAAKWLRSVGLQPVADVTVRRHGSWPGTTHKQCPQHLNAGDWGVTWAQFTDMVKAEYTLLGVANYPAIWGDTFPYFAESGIAQEWRRSATVLGAATSDEHADTTGRVTRHFQSGYVRYDPKTDTAQSFFSARP